MVKLINMDNDYNERMSLSQSVVKERSRSGKGFNRDGRQDSLPASKRKVR